MRAQYEVFAGPHLSVDVLIEDQRIAGASFEDARAQATPEVLGAAARAILGLPADAPATDIAVRIEDALPATSGAASAQLRPLDFACAARRALSGALNWTDIDFDVIHGPVLDPVLNVALDETLVEDVAAGLRKPFMRLWEWNAPQVVIGSFQSYTNEVHPEGVSRHGIVVSRRVSGGGAMFMEPANCVTFSLVVPTTLVAGLSFEQSYPFLDTWVMEALASVGVAARYVPLNDIASEKGKIGGAAQKRWSNGYVLHHVTMSYDVDSAKMKDVLRTGLERLRDKGTASAVKHVDPMRSQISCSRAAVIDAMARTFRDKYGAQMGQLSAADIEKAKARSEVKFSTKEWIHRVP